MGGLLAELGKKLAERWLSLLVLPGAFYLAVAAAARAFGHAHALDVHRLTAQVAGWASVPAARTTGGQVVLLGAVLAGSAAAGLSAQALGSLAEQLTLAVDWRNWPPPLRQLAGRRTTSRRDRWQAAHTAYWRHRDAAEDALTRGDRLDPALRYAAHRAMIRVAVEQPDRPTWSGDRIRAVTVRLERDYYLDLPTVWPHLWLTLPEATRTEITTAREALTRAATLGGWALLYAPLTAWWWPTGLITAALTVTAWRRTRTATDTYALLLEAATRLYAGDLARHLGLDHTGPLTPHTGDALTHLLHTQPPPPPDTGKPAATGPPARAGQSPSDDDPDSFERPASDRPGG